MLEGSVPLDCPRCDDGLMAPAGIIDLNGVTYRLDECPTCHLTEFTRRKNLPTTP